jgi:hypothetical protein
VRKDQRYFVLATTGAGSDLRGPAFGEFDHVAWVTMTQQGPLVANVLLDGVYDENVATSFSNRMMEALNKGVPVQEGAIRVDSASFSSAGARLKCVNDGDKPMKAHLEFMDGLPLRPEQLIQDYVVPPKSVKFFDIALKGVGELKAEELGPLPFDWRLSYDSDLNPPLSFAGTSRIYVEKPLELPKRKKPVVLDGKLDEWDSLPLQAMSSRPPQSDRKRWKDSKDCSFKFAVEHDEKNFYVAVDVTDDNWVRGSIDNAWAQDGIWISIDTDPAKNKDLPEKERKGSAWLMLLPGKDAKDSRDVGRDYAPAGVMGVAVKTKGGYTAEAVIPSEILAKRAGMPGLEITLNLTAYDFDEEDRNSEYLGSYFSWRGEGRPAPFLVK